MASHYLRILEDGELVQVTDDPGEGELDSIDADVLTVVKYDPENGFCYLQADGTWESITWGVLRI